MKTLRLPPLLFAGLLGSLPAPCAQAQNAAAPLITMQPSSLTVAVGAAASFTVAATGTEPLTYQWSKNGTALGIVSSPTLTINSVTTADAGSYTVNVSNSSGSTVSSAAILTVNPPQTNAPIITVQPKSETVSVGGSVTFTVSATGIGTLTYTWSKEGRVVSPSSSPSFTIASAAMADAGTYRVMVSSAGGTVTSADAVLTVVGNTPLPPPH